MANIVVLPQELASKENIRKIKKELLVVFLVAPEDAHASMIHICPKCSEEFPVEWLDTDPESTFRCPECGLLLELWDFPHSFALYQKYWTAGAHYSNDPPNAFQPSEFLDYFLLPLLKVAKLPLPMAHGGPFYGFALEPHLPKLCKLVRETLAPY